MAFVKNSLFCNSCGNPLESDGSCKMCPAGNPRRKPPTDKIDRGCHWNDHGDICGLIGSLSDSTNGQGPWYCSKHWWQLKGYTARTGSAEHMSAREQWYLDHKQPYEIAPMTGAAHLKPMADPNSDLLQRLNAGQLGHRSREPGEDFDDLMQP